uniref:Uncharacterized protein n=1 Tax=Sphenodon punctatus TaxID=8508 RepID=A0A8D0H0D6_SPHPU
MHNFAEILCYRTMLLTNPAAYMGTITGCFLLPVKINLEMKLTMFLVSIPKEHKSFLLLWEPPHWYLKPYASWISCSCVHTASSSLHNRAAIVFKDITSSSISRTGMEGKQASNIRSRRLSNIVYIKQTTHQESYSKFAVTVSLCNLSFSKASVQRTQCTYSKMTEDRHST